MRIRAYTCASGSWGYDACEELRATRRFQRRVEARPSVTAEGIFGGKKTPSPSAIPEIYFLGKSIPTI
jgi:hypothetical protein